jgi:hypothetical protein
VVGGKRRTLFHNDAQADLATRMPGLQHFVSLPRFSSAEHINALGSACGSVWQGLTI